MSLKIRIGENEKILKDNEEVPVIAAFNGQVTLNFCLIDLYTGEKAYYQVSSGMKNESEIFTRLKFQNLHNLPSVRVSVDGRIINKTPDIRKFFDDLDRKGHADPKNYYTFLGLSEQYTDDDAVRKASNSLIWLFREIPEMEGIIHNAASRIREMRENLGFITVSLDVSASEILIDQNIRSALGKPVSLPSGHHDIVVTAGGRDIGSIGIEVKPGERMHVAVPVTPKGGSIFSGHPGSVSPVFIGILVIMMALLLWPGAPVDPSDFREDEIVMFSVMMAIVLYGITNAKKWGLVLIGGLFLFMLFHGGMTAIVSLIILVWMGYFYLHEGKDWAWM